MGEATIQVENWAPPSLNSLDFSTNCSLAREFFRTWFDFSTDRLIEVPEAWESNATFWIPSSIDEVATERFFRAALLPGVKGVPSFGDILDWEYQLRHEYSIELNNSISRGDETSFDPLYFATVIDSPAHGCKDMTCNLGIQADQLADLNGPGVSGLESDIDNYAVLIHFILTDPHISMVSNDCSLCLRFDCSYRVLEDPRQPSPPSNEPCFK